MLRIWIDGSARPNPGRGGMGIVIRGDLWDYTISEAIDGEKVTNNQAEYKALCRALEELITNYSTKEEIIVHSDSEMLVEQMKGQRMAEHGKYYDDYILAQSLSKRFGRLTFHWIPREQNDEANALASRAQKGRI